MPTVFVEDGFRFFFYSNEGNEPRHVHVGKGDAIGKWWLDDLRQAFARGFNAAELRKIRRILKDRADEIRDAWDHHFN